MKRAVSFAFLALLLPVVLSAREELKLDELLKRVVEKAKKSDEKMESLGFYQHVIIRELSAEGEVEEEESRTYQTTWIENKPYAELIKVDGKEPDAKHRKEEEKKKRKFIESLRKDKKDEPEAQLNFTWEELGRKYDFTLLKEGGNGYVLAFVPKAEKLPERNRVEKVLNNMSGKIWIDEGYNMTRAEAKLDRSVGFGWGIIAKVQDLEMKYFQQPYEDIFVPESFYLKYTARILIKTQRKEWSGHFRDIYERPDGAEHASNIK